MATVVRVKRRLDEEPLNAFILNCKKRKITDDLQDQKLDLQAVLKFAGTVSEKENTICQIKKHADLKDDYKKHAIPDITQKLREEKLKHSKSNRYKIVNCFRSDLQDDQSTSTSDKPELTVFEIETDVNENDGTIANKNTPVALENEAPKYVYDLYYTSSDDLGDASLEDCISIHPISENLMFGSMRDNGRKDASSSDSEDSNAENNWRNDYPDESDMESVNDGDIVEALKRTGLGDDLLSSDEDEEGFVYSIDAEGAGFEEDVDDGDVSRYGEMYARFKARSKKIVATNDVNFYYGDEEEYYY